MTLIERKAQWGVNPYLIWQVLHVVGPEGWPAFFFSLWHLVQSLFITYFFFRAPCALSFGMAPSSWGNTEWQIWQSLRFFWCCRWGKGTFPHRLHQEKLVDCQICHAVFDQKTGSIEELKAQGKLKKKHVMNKMCTKCHKQKKKAGEKSGPTTCSKCHIKEKVWSD